MSGDIEPTIAALREWGPDVGDPPDAKTRDYIHPDLERLVMEAITRYPTSRVNPDGTTNGLAAVAAVLAVERWLVVRGVSVPAVPSSQTGDSHE